MYDATSSNNFASKGSGYTERDAKLFQLSKYFDSLTLKACVIYLLHSNKLITSANITIKHHISFNLIYSGVK